MRTGHTSVPPGTKAIVFMRDGHHFVAKFRLKDKGGILKFYDHEDVKARKIRGISAYKPDESNRL